MKRTTQWLGTAGAVALVTAPTMAMGAPGTTQGTSIVNTVSVAYSVGGVSQTAITATDSFTVDRKVDVVVTAQDAAEVSVSPGQTGSVTTKLTYLVTNETNDVTDFLLTATQPNTGTAFGGTDNFDVTNIRVYVDSNNDGVFTAADQEASSLYRIAKGASVRVFVTADIPISRVDGDIASVTLTAQAASGVTQVAGTAGSGGTALTASPAGPNGKTTVETVFADTLNTAPNVQYDGRGAARNDYRVAAARLTVAKYSFVYSDPVVGVSPNARAIPGAIVEYCIVVRNAASGADATGVTVSDVVPTNMTYTASSVWLGGTFATDRCDTNTGAAGSDAANYTVGTTTVSSNFGTMGANSVNTLRFRASIN